MTKKHEHGHDHSSCRGCCGSLDRRDFMTTVGLSALAAPGIFGATTSVMAGDNTVVKAKPRVRAVFLHPKTDR